MAGSFLAWKDATIDLGASCITHELMNPLTGIAIANGIEIAQSELLDFSLRTTALIKQGEK